ncbi:hypothetical protein [Shewanella benthica]|uniref:Uncharacterized protein n=1 Tax=Shewanella benthica KT99 TaxID=314608 RepID=A9DFR4_9GAMM|nr:hypothetical protein [Shewanella benthica]EDP99845.1 hypothetical protein KT99_01469 [Shewanella benthica KT99]
MHQYQQEFGESFDLGFSLENFPILVDKSWHNDVCPSFMFKAKAVSGYSGLDRSESQPNDQYLVLWVDYFNENPDEDHRENTGFSRYTVITATATRFSSSEWDIEIGHDEKSVILFESEDPRVLTPFLEKHSLSTLAISETT